METFLKFAAKRSLHAGPLGGKIGPEEGEPLGTEIYCVAWPQGLLGTQAGHAPTEEKSENKESRRKNVAPREVSVECL